jgi:hypothetical protein
MEVQAQEAVDSIIMQRQWCQKLQAPFSVLATFTYWSKPTGLLSRTGIVPISSTLDTPGPMTKNITDNGILLSAMSGQDTNDPATKTVHKTYNTSII